MIIKHNCQALLDERCSRLLQALGYHGYGLYWGLVETALQMNDGVLYVDSIPRLAKQFHVQKKTVAKILNDFDLFELSEDGTFFRSTPNAIYAVSENE